MASSSVAFAPPSHASSSRKLEDQAATAALLAHKANAQSVLDNDNKLSSAGAAASLKYANPRDLPSFPSRGLTNGDSAAGAAASLGWAKKSAEPWRPDSSTAASKAAMLAKDYKAPPLWQAEQSKNSAKAALLAARDSQKVEIWKPEESSWGSSAANQAFKAERKGAPAPQLDYATAMGRKGSMMAATGAMSGTRKRADSTPVRGPTYPDEANASANALSAATMANKPSRNSKSEYNHDAGSSPFTNMPKEMFTSHPPVAPEVDEKKRADVLRASAVAMAKQMYSVQQKQIEHAQAQRSAQQSAAISAHGRKVSTSTIDDSTAPMRFTNLQEAAQKLAQERLAKLRNEHDQNREYRDYYGSSPPASRLSIRNRVRRRASSDGTLDEDKEQSQKIRAQMSIFTSNLTQVDEKKRQKDREALMAAAQRNVTASLKGMDEKAFKETGKVQPSMLTEWEVKAHAAAQKSSKSRMENYGKIDIGGGRFIDQSEVDAIAARNVQPVLDEINEKAEQQRTRDAELKLEQESQKREAETKKSRDKEVKEINRKLKEQDKEEERERKKDEKAAKAEEKRLAKEEKRKSKDVASPPKEKEKEKGKEEEEEKEEKAVVTVPAAVKADEENKDDEEDENDTVPGTVPETAPDTAMSPVSPISPVVEESSKAKTTPEPGYVAPAGLRTSMERDSDARLEEVIKEGSAPSSPKAGVKGWLKIKFRRSKDLKSAEGKDKEEKGFTGGAALTGASTNNTDATAGTSSAKDSSTKEVALAGKPTTDTNDNDNDNENAIEPATDADEDRLGRSKRRASSVSSLSTTPGQELVQESSKDEEFEEARDNFDDALAPPPTFTATKSASPVRDSKFKEVM